MVLCRSVFVPYCLCHLVVCKYLAMSDAIDDIPPTPRRGVQSSEEGNDVTNYLITNNNGSGKKEDSNATIGTSSMFRRSDIYTFFPKF